MNSANVHEKMNNVQGQVASAVETAKEAAHNVTARVTDFFQGNPFETPVGRKIELTTDATKLATENWGLNMEICDFINNSEEGGRDAIRAIRKRLQTQMGKNNAIVMYTLTLLETCVKNCDQRFKVLVCQKEFVSEMVKLVGAKFDAPQLIQERVLGLIQSWADAFRYHAGLESVVEVYDELKSKGVEFPAVNLDSMAPILTPRRTVFPAVNQDASAAAAAASTQPPSQSNRVDAGSYSIVEPTNGPVAASPEQLAKLRSELDIANVNLTVLRELIKTLKPNCEQPADFELLQQLYFACQEMQRRVVQLIPMIINEEVTYELLTINDEFNAVFEKYERYMTNRSNQSGPSTAPTASAIAKPLSTTDLIDFGDVSKNMADLSVKADNANEGPTSSSGAASLSVKNNDAYVHNQMALGLRTAIQNKNEPISDREAQEIAGWLNADSDEKKNPPVDDGL